MFELWWFAGVKITLNNLAVDYVIFLMLLARKERWLQKQEGKSTNKKEISACLDVTRVE